MNEIELYDKLCRMRNCIKDPFVLEAFKQAMSSGELDLSGYCVSVKLCGIIESILMKSQNIKKLKLCDCMVPPEGFDYIINSLMNNAFIIELNLYGNNIQSEVTKNLGKLLARNSVIKLLVLNWNNIGKSLEAFSIFCDGLSTNESLEYLDLRNNQLCPSCGKYLSSALMCNKQLQVLDLRWNRLQCEGIEYLQNALLENNTLIELHLKGNFAHSNIVSYTENQTKLNEKFESLKVEYESKIAFLLKEMKNLEDGRIRNISKITEYAHKRIIDMEKKIEEVTQKLLQKQDLLSKVENEKQQVEKKAICDKNKLEDTMYELKILQEENINLKECIKTKDSNFITSTKTLEEALAKKSELNESTVKELKEKDSAIEKMKEEIMNSNCNWLAELHTEIGNVEELWKEKMKSQEEKSKIEIETIKAEQVKETCSAIEEKEKKIKSLQIELDKSYSDKAKLMAQLAIWEAKVKNLETKVNEQNQMLRSASEEINTLIKEVKSERQQTKRLKETEKIYSREIEKLNKSIDKLKTDLSNKKEEVREITLQLKEALHRLSHVREEEKLCSELLTSALSRHSAPNG